MKLADHLMLKITGPIDDERRTYHTLLDACHRAGARVCGTAKHEFYPRGFSAIVMISESHASIHTWPERGIALIDYFTCAKENGFIEFENAWIEGEFVVTAKNAIER